MSRNMYSSVSSINETQGLVLVGLSVDGDSQGVERLFGALSAHMWPGMILKSGDKINEPVLPHGEGYLLLPFPSLIMYIKGYHRWTRVDWISYFHR